MKLSPEKIEYYNSLITPDDRKDIAHTVRYSNDGVYNIMIGKTNITRHNQVVVKEIEKVAARKAAELIKQIEVFNPEIIKSK